MHGQRTVTPLVREDVILCCIEAINARYHVPLLTKYLFIRIFHLIAILDMRQRMLPTHQGRSFKCPQFAVLCLHEQILMADSAIKTIEIDINMKTFTPCCMITYREFQLHYN